MVRGWVGSFFHSPTHTIPRLTSRTGVVVSADDPRYAGWREGFVGLFPAAAGTPLIRLSTQQTRVDPPLSGLVLGLKLGFMLGVRVGVWVGIGVGVGVSVRVRVRVRVRVLVGRLGWILGQGQG